MNENVFLWIHIHFCLYISEYSLLIFYKALSIYAFVKISENITSHKWVFSININVYPTLIEVNTFVTSKFSISISNNYEIGSTSF